MNLVGCRGFAGGLVNWILAPKVVRIIATRRGWGARAKKRKADKKNPVRELNPR